MEELDEFGIPIKKTVDEFGIPVKQVDEYGIPMKTAELVGSAIEAISPLGKGVYDLGRTIYSGLTDTAPQTAAQSIEVAKTAINPSNIDEFIRNKRSVDFQRYVRDKDPKYSGIGGFFTPFNLDEALPKYGSQFMQDEGLSSEVKAMEQRRPEVIERRRGVEQYVAQQKREAEEKLGGVVTDYRDINGIGSFASYVGNLLGQAAYQIPLSAGTRGASSYLMESATVYDGQLDRIANELGISREEVIERNLDDPAKGQAYAILAGALDAASAGNLISAFRKGGGQHLKKWLNITSEALTEPTQGVLEEVGSGGTVEEAFSEEGMARRVNELLGGFVGGAAFSVGSKIKQAEAQINQAIAEVGDTGDPQLNAEIDAAASIDPVDKQVLEEVKVADAIQTEQKELEADEKLQKELEEGTESTENDVNLKSAENTATNAAEEAEIKPSQTPEYKEAVDKVTKLQKQFAELDITENADQLLFDLREARQALQKIAGRPASKTSDVKKQIDKTTGVEKQGKTVQLTPQQAIAAQIKILDRGIKLGRDITQETVVSKIKEAAEAAKLSPKQVKAISSRGERVTLTPKSVEAFNKYVEKVVADADYTDKLTQARQSRKKIRSKKKSDNRSFREKSVMNLFAKINPTEVADINEYNELASVITESTPFNLEDVSAKTQILVGKIYQDELQVAAPEGHTVEQMMSDIQAKREVDRETDRIQKVADDLGITIDEARILDESEDNTDSRKERLRQSHIDIAKTKKAEPEVELDKLQAQDVADINSIDPTLLTTDQLKEYIRIVDRINENGDFAMSGRLAAMGKAQVGWKELNSRGMKTLNLTQLEAFMDSQPMAIEAIFGLPKDAALFQLYTGIKGMNDAGALAKREAEIAADFLTNLKKKHPEAFKDESLFRQGMYQELIRTPEAMSPDEALRINKELIQSSINKQRAAGFDKEADIDAKFFKPFMNAQTMDEVHEIMGKIDPSGKKVIGELIKYYEIHRIEETGQTILELIASDNERFENKETEPVLNYGGPRSWKNIGRGQVTDMDDVVAFNPAFARASKPKQLKSGMSLSMRDRDGAILDFNIHKNTIDNIEKSILRSFAKPHQYQLRDFLRRDEDLLKLFGGTSSPESVRRANNMIDALFNERTGIVFNFERDLMNNSRAYPNKFVKNFANFMNGLKKIGYGITLSGWTQLPKQATVLSNVARQLGSDAGLIGSSVRESKQDDYQKFFRGQTVDIRGEQSAILNVGRFYSASERLEAQGKFSQWMNTAFPLNAEKRFRGKWGGAGVLVSTDVNVTKTSFLAFYMKYLKDNGVKYEGVQRELELRSDKTRQEALAYAKQRTDTLQVVSTTAEQSAFFKEQGFLPELARAFFVPYGGFASNSKTRLFNDYKALAFGSSDQKKQAWKDIQGTAIEQASFNVVSQGVKLGMYGAVGMLLRNMLDLEDEEEWSEWWAKTKKQVGKDMILSNLPVILGSPGEDMMVDFLNSMYYEFLKLENPDLSQSEYEKDHAPIARYKGYDDKWWDYLGPYGAPMAKLAESFKLYEQADNEELSREQQTLALVAMLSQLAQFKGLLPADIANAVRGEFNKQKAASKEEGSITNRPISRPRPRPRPRPARNLN